MNNNNENEIVYLTEKEIDEIAELKTTVDAVMYIRDMPEKKKRLVMKQFAKETAILQWKAIATERY